MSQMTRLQPAREMLTLSEAMERVFSQNMPRFYQTSASGDSPRSILPRADAWENDDEVMIELALPGVDPAGVEVTFEKDTVLVTGETTVRDEAKSWVITERARGKFERRFHLTVPVQVDEAAAEFRHGILTLRLPKREETKPRKIAVQVAA